MIKCQINFGKLHVAGYRLEAEIFFNFQSLLLLFYFFYSLAIKGGPLKKAITFIGYRAEA